VKTPRNPSARYIFPQAYDTKVSITFQPFQIIPFHTYLEVARVHLRVDLSTTFHQIKRCDSCMGQAACQQPAESTGSVVLGRVELNSPSFRLCLCTCLLELLRSLCTQCIGFILGIVDSTPCWIEFRTSFERSSLVWESAWERSLSTTKRYRGMEDVVESTLGREQERHDGWLIELISDRTD